MATEYAKEFGIKRAPHRQIIIKIAGRYRTAGPGGGPAIGCVGMPGDGQMDGGAKVGKRSRGMAAIRISELMRFAKTGSSARCGELPPPVRMAKKLDPYRETARMALEQWLVEAAFACLPQTPSSPHQRPFLYSTPTPPTVMCAAWWSARP